MKSFRALLRPPASMRAWILGCALLGTVTLDGREVEAAAPSSSTELGSRLRSSDFRVRVQAALLLGKTSDRAALNALLAALRDESAAVRAASAAALGTLGDPVALGELRKLSTDSNPAVRRQAAATVKLLEKTQKDEAALRKKAQLLVKLDGMKTRVHGGAPETVGAAAQASLKLLGKLPGIALLHPSEDPEEAGKKHGRPVLVVQGSIKELSAESSGTEFVVSADVEFVVQSMPEYAIVGKLSGNASVSGEAAASDVLARTRVQEAAVGAAVDSALRRSQAALLKAAQAS